MEKLSNPQVTIQTIKKYEFAFQKKFGQNFLIDDHVITKMRQKLRRTIWYWRSDRESEQ